nr:hypothetical protein HmN_000637900 [Hymenolepis microstoma]
MESTEHNHISVEEHLKHSLTSRNATVKCGEMHESRHGELCTKVHGTRMETPGEAEELLAQRKSGSRSSDSNDEEDSLVIYANSFAHELTGILLDAKIRAQADERPRFAKA